MKTPIGFDVRAFRALFPALEQEVRGRPLAYLDNAATTQKPEPVLRALQEFYRRDNANVHRGVHLLSQRATDAFERARETVARFVNAREPAEIVFTKGCTEALNLVAWSWGRLVLRPGDVVLLSHAEHHANIVPWQLAAEAAGAQVRPFPIRDDGTFGLEALEKELDARVKVVGVKHVCNALGTIHPVAEIARLAHAVGAKVVVDGAQAAAHLRIDVQALGVDFYALSGHKAYGPTGVGALWARRELLEEMPPYQGGGDMIRMVSFEGTTFNEVPHKFEAGTPPIADAVAFGEALRFLEEWGIEALSDAEGRIARLAAERLAEIPGVRLLGPLSDKASVLSFVMECAHPHDIGTILDSYGVAVRTGHHCCMPLMRRLRVPATVRASFAPYNTEEDVEALIEGVEAVVRTFS